MIEHRVKHINALSEFLLLRVGLFNHPDLIFFFPAAPLTSCVTFGKLLNE
jgi:hypothetical protein